MCTKELALEVNNLGKSLDNNEVLTDISFKLGMGCTLGLLGPNGAGKTTLLRMLLGLLEIDKGKIVVLGENVDSGTRQQNQHIGFVLDKTGFYKNESARNNLINFGLLYEKTENQINEQIEKYSSILGLSNKLDKKVKTYSKGMLQKLSLIRSLVHTPSLLILDEPTSGLDPHMQVQVRKLISILKEEGKTIIFSSHILSEVEKVADSLLIISLGKVKFYGENVFDDNNSKDIIVNKDKIDSKNLEDFYLTLTEEDIYEEETLTKARNKTEY